MDQRYRLDEPIGYGGTQLPDTDRRRVNHRLGHTIDSLHLQDTHHATTAGRYVAQDGDDEPSRNDAGHGALRQRQR